MCGGGGDGSDNDSYSATRPSEEAGGEAQTYRSSMTGVIESNTGDTRSDQDMENDSRLSEALERGDQEFKDATTGKTRNVDTYGRSASPPLEGSLLANLNTRPSVGTLLGAATSFALGGIPGTIAGQAVKYGTNSFLGGR